jgi:hypothetical protein
MQSHVQVGRCGSLACWTCPPPLIATIRNNSSPSPRPFATWHHVQLWLCCGLSNFVHCASQTKPSYMHLAPSCVALGILRASTCEAPTHIWVGVCLVVQYWCYLQYLTWERRLQMLHDVAAGMSYLHGRNVAHGDLRSPNLFVGADGRVSCIQDT